MYDRFWGTEQYRKMVIHFQTKIQKNSTIKKTRKNASWLTPQGFGFVSL